MSTTTAGTATARLLMVQPYYMWLRGAVFLPPRPKPLPTPPHVLALHVCACLRAYVARCARESERNNESTKGRLI